MVNELSVSEAIQLSGISRATFYRKFITTGKISIKEKSGGKKYIEFGELLRVCPEAGTNPTETHEQDKKNTLSNDYTRDLLSKNQLLELELKLTKELLTEIREQLRKSDIREADLKLQLAKVQPTPLQIGWIGRLMLKKVW